MLELGELSKSVQSVKTPHPNPLLTYEKQNTIMDATSVDLKRGSTIFFILLQRTGFMAYQTCISPVIHCFTL